MYPRLSWKLTSSSLHLLSAGITGLHHHTHPEFSNVCLEVKFTGHSGSGLYSQLFERRGQEDQRFQICLGYGMNYRAVQVTIKKNLSLMMMMVVVVMMMMK